MASDPAVLWYWNDWHGGTCTLSRFLKGCYMDLLHAQFNNGNLSLDEIKTVLGSDFGSSWPTLQKKFKTDDKGLFFNERLVTEAVKRKTFTKSRKENLKGKAHMAPHMENENEDENVKRKKKIENHLFIDSEFFDFKKFQSEFLGTEYEKCDLRIYHEKVKNWSASGGNKKIDWIATARNFMLSDKEKGKLVFKKVFTTTTKEVEKPLTEKEIKAKNQEADNLTIELINEEYQNFLEGKDINDSLGWYARFITDKGKMNGSLKGVFQKIKEQGLTVKEYLQ